MKYSFAFLLSLGMASATATTNPTIKAPQPTDSLPKGHSKLIVTSGPGRISSVDFDGSAFNITNKIVTAGTNPSWAVFKKPNFLYTVNENANTIGLFTYDRTTNKFDNITTNAGSTGVVFLEFNKDQSHMVGASFTNGSIDAWDTSASDGSLKLLKTTKLDDKLGGNTLFQTAVQAHQAVLDPSGRFFIVPERGADTLSVIDSKADAFNVVQKVRVEPDGCGPRHGTFIKSCTGDKATHFVFVCELKNVIQLYSVAYTDKALELTHVQTESTFGKDMPSKNPTDTVADATKTFAAAGECVVASNQRDIYVSNRLTGNPADSIVHFTLERDEQTGTAKLVFGESVSSYGISPRMFSLALGKEDVLFSTNQNNGTGLLAYKRDADGKLAVIEDSKVDIAKFRDSVAEFGPEFVQQI
ncbi:putative isomerase YbhE [Lophium mytilinum]|uniref:Putative isomerase YbhE n=1 Tax=Lophium mytilinum TaxID=390894 RepID=A0A6A6QAW3_9PEZI|nr:putative isomerase YbhE [Lophium mytilinum]